MFGILIITYLFLGGAAAGALLVTCTWSILFHAHRIRRPSREIAGFNTLRSNCYATAFVLLIFSIACLLWDLGSPERALNLFLHPHLSILSIGSFILSLEAILAGALALATFFDFHAIGGNARRVLEYCCAVFSCGVIIYTGVFLAANKSVPLWSTWTLVALFFFSSFSSGSAVVMLLDYFNPDDARHANVIRPMSAIHCAGLAFETVFLAAFLNHAFTTAAASESLALLLSPSILQTGIIGALGMGILIPFGSEIRTLAFAEEGRAVPFSDFACLVGGFLLRYCVIVCGVH
ncbi:NrfD/PsrC family molybdoenzyme membrane anchor subunit [Curtanaerobium respiraculi]|uniref:NrfD/PsrC family molybdoenzyme membrane anchor subunit n=1 Tax=Curtanaerobium respiraculi TaxID=2949669 RepID=UPI0024B3BD15|nr:NrfD/PsrC family molybdoenzyme membrane anchor subunit [Curtanaerobium respiraculi]